MCAFSFYMTIEYISTNVLSCYVVFDGKKIKYLKSNYLKKCKSKYQQFRRQVAQHCFDGLWLLLGELCCLKQTGNWLSVLCLNGVACQRNILSLYYKLHITLTECILQQPLTLSFTYYVIYIYIYTCIDHKRLYYLRLDLFTFLWIIPLPIAVNKIRKYGFLVIKSSAKLLVYIESFVFLIEFWIQFCFWQAHSIMQFMQNEDCALLILAL